MKTDIYTKIILSVIAISLVWIAVQLTPSASAGPEIQQVDIIKIDGKPVAWAALPVKVAK